MNTVKYLDLYIDDTLSWVPHVQYLSLHLARLSGLFYKLRNFVNINTLSMLYYSLVYSKVQYGIIAWGTTSLTNSECIQIKLNKILRIILSANIYTPQLQHYIKTLDS